MSRAAGAVALGGALLLSAAVFDSPSLYVPGIGLCLLGVGAVAWVRLAASGAGLTRVPGPSTVIEGQAWPLRIELRSGLLPPPGGAVVEPLLSEPVPIGPLRPPRVRIKVRFDRRGRRTLAPAVLELRDPLALCVRRVAGEGGGEVLVLPRVDPVVATGGGGSGTGRGALGGAGHGPSATGLQAAAAELEVDGLRPYREGTSASRIHWPAVARTREMLERRMVADADSAPLVVLDSASPASEEALDSAVRAAASLALHLAQAGGCAVLLPNDRRPLQLGPDLGGWPAVHARLAAVEAGGRCRLDRAARSGAVFWVTGAARLPAQLVRLVAGARWLVSPGPPARGRAAFTVSGCTGVRLERRGRAVAPRARGRRAA